MKDIRSAEAVLDALGASPDAALRLRRYVVLLAQWNPRINLVGPATLPDVWTRHILDSGQLARLVPDGQPRIVDLGSGAGLPGLVLAMLGAGAVHLIESDTRKCAFLSEAARATETAVAIHATRIEAAPALAADIVTARALAPLIELLDLARRFLPAGGRCLFLKGRRWQEEVEAALLRHRFACAIVPSASDPAGAILDIALSATA